MKKYSEIILITQKNEFILQRRENKRNIDNTGLITVFGVVFENNETHLDCILREIKEELDFNLKSEEIKYFIDFDKISNDKTIIKSRFYEYNLPN